MEVIILAGGHGTRLKSVVSDVPKPMAPIAGKPFLEIMLTRLASQGISRVILSTGYMADKISGYFGKQFLGMDLIYSTEKTPLGTGGAVRQALAYCKNDHVLVMNGDTYVDVDLSKLESFWNKNPGPLIVAKELADTSRYGRLVVNNERIIRFGEKTDAGPGLINVGSYVLSKYSLDAFLLGQVFSLEKDFFCKQSVLDKLKVFLTEGRFIDIGVPEDYFLAQKMLACL